MKHQKRWLAGLLALLVAVSCFGCGKGTAESPAESPKEENTTETAITVTDMSGREITLEEPAARVVVLTAADCEILYAIGAGDTLVGRGSYCDYPAEVLDVPSVQSGYDTNIEQIIALQPEVLITSTMAQTKEQVAALEAAGVTVVTSNADNIADTYTSIELIGKVTGREEEAAAVIGEMEETFRTLSENTPEDEAKSIYFEVSPLEYGLWAAGANTFMDEICTMIGMKNIFAEVKDWGEVSEEQVIQRNPDYIVTITMYYGEGPTPEEEIASRAGWDTITAVKNGAILNLQNNELSRPSPRLAEGAKLLYGFVYGEQALAAID